MVTTLTFGGYQGDNSVHTRAALVFQDAVARLSGGSVAVEFKMNITEAGRKGSDLLSMTEAGELDGCYFSSSYLASRVPELALFDQHFAVVNRRQAYGVLDGDLGKRLAQEVGDKTGYTVLAYWDNGLRHISTTGKGLQSPEDCKDLKLRTLASDDHQRVFRALGFEPTVIDVRDLPCAVASGQVDAQENPLTNIYNFDLHKTHRTITLTGHLLGVALVLFNSKSVDSWSPEVREVVSKALAEATAAQRTFAEQDDEICTKALTADGVSLITLSPEERETFAKSARAEVMKTRERFNSELLTMFDNDIAKVPS